MLKVKKMCELIRQYQPDATIVVGGHIANMPDLRRADRRRPHRQGRRRPLVPRFPGRRPGPARSAIPMIPSRHRHAEHGHHAQGEAGRRGGHADPVGRLPDGMQLLLHLGHVRRQGEVRQLLRDGRRAVRRHVPARAVDEGPVVLRHGRELPAAPQASACGCWN